MYRIGLKLWTTNTGAYLAEAERLYGEGVFDYLELFVVPDTLDMLPHWKALKMPFVIHNAHAAQGFNLADPECRERNREIYAQTKRFADELNARYIIFHGGIDGTVDETIRQLLALNEPRALLENKPFVPLPNPYGAKFCRGATKDEIGRIIAETGCGFCLDIGHAVCSAASQGLEPYAFVGELNRLFRPTMYHLSDVLDMTSPYDAHPHLGHGVLDLARIKREIFPPDARISVETEKDSEDDLEDFLDDVRRLRHG